ncbi:MAG: T9SS type A sorting domain-containing protein [Bacteroidota bacterium]
MKTALRLFYFTCFFIGFWLDLKAQPELAVFRDSLYWNIKQFQHDSETIFHFFMLGDTIIDNNLYKRMAKGPAPYQIETDYLGDEVFLFFLRHVGDSVIIRKPADFWMPDGFQDDILFNYGLAPDSTHFWDLANIEPFITSPNATLFTVDTLTTLDGVKRRVYRYNLFTDPLIEGIGLQQNGFPFMGIYLDTGYFLRCLTLPDQLIYSNLEWITTPQECYDFTLSTETPIAVENDLFPNPSNGNFYYTNALSDINLNVYSLTGELVHQISNFSGNRLDLSFLPAGMYFLQHLTEVPTVRKIVIID